MNLPFYVLVNIGCIECGVTSNIVLVTTDKSKADGICDTLNNSKKAEWRGGGQNAYEVFAVTQLETIAPAYQEYL